MPRVPKPPNPNKGIRKRNKETKVDIPLIGSQEVVIPEFFANRNVSKTGKISYRLVNPLTKSRNLAQRQGVTSVKLIRKPTNHMIIHSHSTEPISLDLFSRKDREIIDRHYKVVEENKDKDVADIPHSQPFENKERGRPEKLPKNIEINKERKKAKRTENITMAIAEQPKEKRQYKKHTTDEERRESILASKRAYAKKAYAKKKGGGVYEDFKNAGNKIMDTAKSVGKKVGEYANTIISGRNDFPPKVRTILEKVGNETINSITIGRTPVPSVLTSILSVVSGGKFGENMKNAPYDTLFHLFINLKLSNGKSLMIEKNEVINMDINKGIPPHTETLNVSNVPSNLTPNMLMENAKRVLGGKFFTYSARDNNCQDFIMAIFNGSNLGNQEDKTFIKQDTKQLFGNMTGLRKFTNTITDIAGKVNEITTGKGVQPDFVQYSDDDSSVSSGDELVLGKGITKKRKNKISNKSIMPKFVKGSQEAKDYMAKIRGMKGKGILDNATRVVGSATRDLHNDIRMDGGGMYAGNGLYAGAGLYATGGQGLYSSGGQPSSGRGHKKGHKGKGVMTYDSDSGSDSDSDMEGSGIHIHHHYHMNGGKLSKIGSAFNRAFNPSKNGVAKAVNSVAPAIVNDAKVVGHYAIPAITAGLGGLAGGVLGGLATGGAGGEFVGGVAGSALGSYAGNQLNREIGISGNTSFGKGFKKGSQEAKDHMAKIRGMRKK